MDFHSHLDLYPNAREVYAEAWRRNDFTWLVTTSPKAFAATSRVLGVSPKILITPGLHPEIAAARSNELPTLLQQIESATAVGEVGLDGSPRFRAGYQTQKDIFQAVVERCAKLGGRTLSIHSRQAVKDVLAELARNPGYGTAVLHWFSGSTSELRAADQHGCWFSVGPAMLESANGRNIVANIPRDRVVPESDGPFAKVAGKVVMPWCLDDTALGLAQLWNVTIGEAVKTLAENSARLLVLMKR